jgi:hypothetical protein
VRDLHALNTDWKYVVNCIFKKIIFKKKLKYFIYFEPFWCINLKNYFLKKNIILIYFNKKKNLKNNYNYNFKRTIITVSHSMQLCYHHLHIQCAACHHLWVFCLFLSLYCQGSVLWAPADANYCTFTAFDCPPSSLMSATC